MSLFHAYTQRLEVILSGKSCFTICADEESRFDRVSVSVYIAVATIGVVFVFTDFTNSAVGSQLAVFGRGHCIPQMFFQGRLFVAYKSHVSGATFSLY